VQTNRIFLTPLKARKGDTHNQAVQAVEKFRNADCGLRIWNRTTRFGNESTPSLHYAISFTPGGVVRSQEQIRDPKIRIPKFPVSLWWNPLRGLFSSLLRIFQARPIVG
jgi:hypothetical protein